MSSLGTNLYNMHECNDDLMIRANAAKRSSLYHEACTSEGDPDRDRAGTNPLGEHVGNSTNEAEVKELNLP